MPYLERAGAPRLYYELDDYTDPWKNAPCIVLQHGYACRISAATTKCCART